MSSPSTGRSSGSSTGERSNSAGGWVSPRPISTEARRKRSAPTTRTPMTKTTKPSTSAFDRTARQRCPHPPAAVALHARRLGGLDDGDRLGHVVGERDQVEVGGVDRAGGYQRGADPVEQPRPVLTAEQHHREAGDLAGLHEGERLEQLVERAEPAR